MTTHPFQKYLLLPAVLLFLFPGLSHAQTAKPTQQPLITVPENHPAPSPAGAKPGESVDKIVDSFFALLGKGQIDEAYDDLTAGTDIAKKAGYVGILKSKTTDAVKVFGEFQGYELINIKNIGTHLMCASYLSLGKNLPLRWKFYFYKSDQTWRFIDIRVDDGLVNMFEDANPHPQPADAQ